MIRSALDKDVASIANIYNYYISETVATFETEVISPKSVSDRIAKVQNDNLPWLIAEDDSGQVIGYGVWQVHCLSGQKTVYTVKTP